MSECSCHLNADECTGGVGIFYPLQEGGECSSRLCEAVKPEVIIKNTPLERQSNNGWFLSKDGLPDIGEQVVAGFFYQDAWLIGSPIEFSWGKCMVVHDTHPDFKDNKRWLTFGPSHNQITHWKRIGSLPNRL